MPGASGFESVDVAVLLIERAGDILLVFNPNWGGYTLPMTKRRNWQDPQVAGKIHQESWEDAAIRARAEYVQGTTTDAPQPLLEIPEFQQSDRDGHWKKFRFQVFKMTTAEGSEVAPGINHEWLRPEDLFDERRRPISKTARDVVAQAKEQAESQGRKFP